MTPPRPRRPCRTRTTPASSTCGGWLRSRQNDSLSIGYYRQADLPFLGRAAADWTTFDRYFSAVMTETYPNRFYMHGARADRLHDNLSLFTYPTIWSRLKATGVPTATTTATRCGCPRSR